MKVLIVYAHPEPKSFNGALKDIAIQTLKEEGHEIKVSDLYAMNFNPVAQKDDFEELSDETFFKYAKEQKHNYLNDTLNPIIKSEFEKLLWADFIIFQFPLWWFSVPAILKGWFDKVLLFSGVYGGEYGRYDKARLTNKIAMISTTTGSPKGSYTPHGYSGDIYEQILFHINHGMLYFTGITPLEPFIAYTVSHSQNDRKNYIEIFKSKLQNIDKIKRIEYPKLKEYNENGQLT
ncbi:NAD(P)H-dependent oxidoreductase [Mammaliicoccus sciuri]|uniref:NAD(P)H-dependent oxidoreductase n=2 Tax=Mammaliicoccus sciuri TaxID=1296 RepID=UPI0018E1C7F8|nr:NAD(P)H-dependent oxidoreductase [Mammaliicoccus sciuri]MCD8808079.1 NAD(P)H-dependent oxidoreductase [Mammaliicoccus sciuri]MCD8894330.1 NAD(P)H-dependent oxidoreductase [Mammaliicoccus sciuri]MCD8912683.1 NAD(P)H-dependent oxidoreductase [Mammaliicoccus sciuri]MEB7065482.1 NAD(P)H-dependent oxidoreductase [Mammaliicoccus sciuri]QQC94441.1 NAD(P)H-dependent oxidoreductase [Mammaliicoccus sciuri]